MNKRQEQWLAPSSAKEAILFQKEMAKHIILHPFDKPIKTIAGMDISCNPFDPEKMVYAALVVLSFPEMTLLETATVSEKQTFPYISGLLGFREAPALLRAYNRLTTKPDIALVDGHGISHPRKVGIATHLGILLNLPTIGVAKSILIGHVDKSNHLVWKSTVIGYALQSKKRCKPIYISPGYKTDLNSATKIVNSCLKGYRLPEPTRQAHNVSNTYRKMLRAQPCD